jgi:hypothetical protein
MPAGLAEALNPARAQNVDVEALGQVLEANPIATVTARACPPTPSLCFLQAQSGLVGTDNHQELLQQLIADQAAATGAANPPPPLIQLCMDAQINAVSHCDMCVHPHSRR